MKEVIDLLVESKNEILLAQSACSPTPKIILTGLFKIDKAIARLKTPRYETPE
jgi:hypothetical protein